MKSLSLLDSDGNRVAAGDIVRFNYGIPPVAVDAKIVQRGKSLIALTPGHSPKECNLRSLRRYVGQWLKIARLTQNVGKTSLRAGRMRQQEAR